jgi:superfamily I DNA and/or RNA helicase
MIISTVRANANRSLGFVSDPRRVNVSITRARRGLVIVGHENTLRCDKKVWGPYVNWMIDSGLAMNIKGKPEMIRAVNEIECDLSSVSRPFQL